MNTNEKTAATTTPVTASIVSETDFPRGSTRLQELMKDFSAQSGMPQEFKGSISNPLAKVTIVDELADKKFKDLTPAQQQSVLSRIANIDYTVSSHIQNFGSTHDSPMTKHAEVIISKYSANEFGDLANPITDLAATLKASGPKSVVDTVQIDTQKKTWGIFSSLKAIGAIKKAKKKMYKIMAEHDSMKKNLDVVSVALKKQQVNLQNDIQVYEGMIDVTFDQIAEFEYDCIALDLMIEDAQEKLNAIVSKGTIGTMEAVEAKNLKAAIERMLRRKNTIMSIRVSTVQNVPMISGIILGDEIVCEKIDEVQSLVIPMWTWQYAIAIGHLKQQEALSIQKTIRGITSKLLKGNAQMLHDNIIAAQEELHAAAVAIEDLQEVQKYIDDMVTTVQSKSNEALQQCISGMKTMREIEQKNYDLMSQELVEGVASVSNPKLVA